jgi:hypothetical protein
LKNKTIFLGEVLGEYSQVTVDYDDDDNEWTIEEITLKNKIKAFKIMDCFLFNNDRINQCINDNEENDENEENEEN